MRLILLTILVFAIQVLSAPRINGQENILLDSLLAQVQPVPIAESQ